MRGVRSSPAATTMSFVGWRDSAYNSPCPPQPAPLDFPELDLAEARGRAPDCRQELAVGRERQCVDALGTAHEAREQLRAVRAMEQDLVVARDSQDPAVGGEGERRDHRR